MKSKRIMALLLAGAALMGMTICGCGSKIQDNATFATLDDTTITMGVANFCAKYEQAMYDSIYTAYFGEDMWNSDLSGSGNTMTEDVKSGVAEQLQEMYLLKTHMDEYGVTVSEEEEAAILKAADDFIADNSAAAVRQIGAENKENVIETLRLYTIRHKMHDRIIQDADADVSDEEAAQRTFSYVKIDTDAYTDADSNRVEYTEEDKKKLKKTAEDIAVAEDLDTAAADEGFTVSTASYGSAKDENASFDTAVLEAADALKKEGEISPVVEKDTACYILRLDSKFDKEATASKKESMISQKQEDYFNDMIDGWKEDCTWKIDEEEWAKVVFDDRFSRPQEEETESLTDETAGTESTQDTQESAAPAGNTETTETE